MPPSSGSVGATTPSGTGVPPKTLSNSYRDSTLAVFSLLLAFRIVNALTLRTFFQPDEYFQSLEPAWQLAFGESSNAWITWEWKTQLRSSLHPALFAAIYRVAAKLADICGLTLSARAELLVAAPKVTQAVFAALIDGYTWKLAGKVYGHDSRAALATLALSVCSPWQWFCSTRTLSNCLETTLTSIAIYHWPWHWHGNVRDGRPKDKGELPVTDEQYLGSLKGLRLSLLLAALACVLRPTNALIWLSVGIPTLWQASNRMRYVCIREILFCGSAVLVCSSASDRLYYGVWTLPPVRFLYFNIAQSLAVFYGKNRPDYYLTEGLPLLLTTAVPFAVIGLWQALRRSVAREPSPSVAKSSSNSAAPGQTIQQQTQQVVLSSLAWTCLTMTTALSLISHKEVRFLYPILPFLHILSARPLSNFLPASAPPSRKLVISLVLAINLLLAGYTSQVHQRGVIDVLTHLRHKHEAHHKLSTPSTPLPNTTIAFLMPCHSTPWRSHLVHPSLSAWALTCEPPLDIPLSDRPTYLDEADKFYLQPGPTAWLRANMHDINTIATTGSPSSQHWARLMDPLLTQSNSTIRPWPQHLVFFAQLEDELAAYLRPSRYRECWRGFNSQWHDDWRRVGDVVVWCLDGV